VGKDIDHLHDVTKEDDWCKVIEAIDERFGRLDGLVNNPVGRANSPGYGHLKLPHLKIGRAADLRRVKQDVYFRSLQPRRGWGVERLEATAAKHSIYVT
jgi:NAD(P)-dependent dehydrogenase (short-subunit alcohol dehydrogenase family)